MLFPCDSMARAVIELPSARDICTCFHFSSKPFGSSLYITCALVRPDSVQTVDSPICISPTGKLSAAPAYPTLFSSADRGLWLKGVARRARTMIMFVRLPFLLKVSTFFKVASPPFRTGVSIIPFSRIGLSSLPLWPPSTRGSPSGPGRPGGTGPRGPRSRRCRGPTASAISR